jgi:hypothetical protein
MVTPQQALVTFGAPEKEKGMILWDVPAPLEIGTLPNRIYCNKLMIEPLSKAFKQLIDTGYVKELKTWDGCFNIRYQRGSRTAASLHSWGLAIDVNAAWNQLGKEPTLSCGFVRCFTENGFDWGGDFKRKDGMHFQLKSLT